MNHDMICCNLDIYNISCENLSDKHDYRTMQLDKTVWGPDALEFKPERWLAEDAASKEKYWLVVCGSPYSLNHDIYFTNSIILVWPRICFLSRT